MAKEYYTIPEAVQYAHSKGDKKCTRQTIHYKCKADWTDSVLVIEHPLKPNTTLGYQIPVELVHEFVKQRCMRRSPKKK